MEDPTQRRHFVIRAASLACLFSVGPLGLIRARAPEDAEAAIERPWQINIANAREPGTRIRIRGTVCDPAGHPLPNVRIFLYHTDAEGYYTRPISNPRNARLHGTLWTNGQGGYEFSSIQPGHYVRMSEPPPRHVHVHLHPPGLPDHWVESFFFAGDRWLRPSDVQNQSGVGRFSNIVTLARGPGGVMEGMRDFRIDAALAAGNALVNGWYRGE
jgi:protocatechuate 3,4-dioxygenase beta subunit